MRELRKLIRQVIKEARTKQPGDLPQSELLGLINYVLTGDGIFDFSEKFAGSHVEILQKSDTGEFFSKSKSGRAAGSGWNPARGNALKISSEMSSLETPQKGRRFAFEFIDSSSRPDYVNYLIGDKPAAIEYTGELTKQESDSLNSTQSKIRFVSLNDISYDSFDLSGESLKYLEDSKTRLESGNLKRSEIKEIGALVSNIIAGSVQQSLLGGPIEGIVVNTPDRLFKMPNPDYSSVQKIQSPLYAMFSGRGGVSKKEIKSRVVSADPNDRLIQDMKKYLESIPALPSGFRTFFSSEEAESIKKLVDSATSGDQEKGVELYSIFNKRVNTPSSWTET